MSRRIDSIDIMRGFVILLMALDHVRDYFSNAHFPLLDPNRTTTALYLTRWITHLCAPTFVFLAGISARLMAQRLSTRELSGFLLKRGLWLVLLEITVVLWGWSFSFRYEHGVFLQVIWAIGASMVALSALVYLPPRVVGWLGVVIVAGHNLLDPVPAATFGVFAPAWSLLHVHGPIAIGLVSYPALPWIGVMALGFAAGSLYEQDQDDRRWILCIAGSVAIVVFFLMRAGAFYGDPRAWMPEPTLRASLMTLFDVQKYPPSLLYVLITLGIAAILLSVAESVNGVVARVLKTYGRVPLFFYVTHIFVAHFYAGVTGLALGFGTAVFTNNFRTIPASWGVPLPLVYIAWLAVLLTLYPLCRWFGELKRTRKEWWWSYL